MKWNISWKHYFQFYYRFYYIGRIFYIIFNCPLLLIIPSCFSKDTPFTMLASIYRKRIIQSKTRCLLFNCVTNGLFQCALQQNRREPAVSFVLLCFLFNFYEIKVKHHCKKINAVYLGDFSIADFHLVFNVFYNRTEKLLGRWEVQLSSLSP